MESRSGEWGHYSYDVLVNVDGSAGDAAGRKASEAGAEVASVDHGPLRGLCIHHGCMSTKAILRSAQVTALMRRANEFGLSPVEVDAQPSTIVDRRDQLVSEFADYHYYYGTAQ